MAARRRRSNDVLFLADCISFDHDLPTVVRPSAETNVAGMRPSGSLLPSPAASAGLWYSDVLPEAQGLAAEMRLGAPVVLRYGEGERSLVQFEFAFAGVGEALGFYAMALRELDEPGEYLGMYRLLAWADGDDGRSFVATHLKSVAEFDFGMLRTEPNRHGTSVDVFEHYRELAARCRRLLRPSVRHVRQPDRRPPPRRTRRPRQERALARGECRWRRRERRRP